MRLHFGASREMQIIPWTLMFCFMDMIISNSTFQNVFNWQMDGWMNLGEVEEFDNCANNSYFEYVGMMIGGQGCFEGWRRIFKGEYKHDMTDISYSDNRFMELFHMEVMELLKGAFYVTVDPLIIFKGYKRKRRK